MIEITNLTKRYGEFTAVKGMTFTLEDGEIYGFLGVNGAGKSTTMNMLAGCLSVDSGDIFIDGINIRNNANKIKKMIGYLPETPPLYNEMTTLEYLHFVASAKGIKGNKLKEEVSRVIDLTSINDVKNRVIQNLSKGYKQRIGIAQAILGDPKFIILDEPTAGLDPNQIVEVRNMIKSFKGDKTVILSSHILSEITAICDKLLIISNGEIIAFDSAENLLGKEKYLELEIKANSPKKAESLLKNFCDNTVDSFKTEYGYGFKIRLNNDDIREKIFNSFSQNNIPIIEMHMQKNSLEDIFAKLISESYKKEAMPDDVCI